MLLPGCRERNGVSRGGESIRIDRFQYAASEFDAGRRWGNPGKRRVGRVLRLEHQLEGTVLGSGRALMGTGDGCAKKLAVQRHGRRGDGDRSAIASLDVTRLVMAPCRKRIGIGVGDLPLRLG